MAEPPNDTAPHWVEDLFPAKFGLTLENILQEELPTQRDDTEVTFGSLQKQDSIFAQLARNVSPLDVAGIKNVFERVWTMKYLEDEERRRREQEDERKIHISTVKKVPITDASTSTADLCENIDIQDPCIWNTNEIHTLRTVFQTAKDQNKKLRVELFDAQDQLKKIRAKHEKGTQDHDVRTNKLKEAIKANQRLNILTKNLKAQVDSATRQIDGLKAHVAELSSSRKDLMQEVHALRIATDHERLDHKKAELALQHHTSEALRERRIHEENLKLMHDEDIQYLQKTVDELSDELSKEKKDHERTKRGLNHLRQHFSSLSMHEDPEGSVKDDQLKTFSY